MSNEALNTAQLREVQQIAKLEVQEYFNHFLTSVEPTLDRKRREWVHLQIEAHNDNRGAHGDIEHRVSKVEKKFDRARWFILGMSIAGGGAGSLAAGLIRPLLALGG